MVVLRRHCAQHPIDEPGRHARVANSPQSRNRHGRIADPAESVVPVALLAHRLRKRSGRSSHERAGVVELHQLQSHRRAHHLISVAQRAVRAPRPQHPVGAGALEHQLRGVRRRRLHLVVVAQQQVARLGEFDLIATEHCLAGQISVEVDRLVDLVTSGTHARRGTLDQASSDPRASRFKPAVLQTRIVFHPQSRCPAMPLEHTHDVRGRIAGRPSPAVPGVARHEINHAESCVAVIGHKLRHQDVGVLFVGLLHSLPPDHLDAHLAATLLIENRREHRAGIEVRQAGKNNRRIPVDECAAATIADHPVVVGVCSLHLGCGMC